MRCGRSRLLRPRETEGGAATAMSLAILSALAILGLAVLTMAERERSSSTRTRNRAEALYVAEAGLQVVTNTLKANASSVVGASFPVLPGRLTSAAGWGLTAANYPGPGALTFNNMAGGQFVLDDSTSNVVVTVPGIGRGTARVTVWLRSVGAAVPFNPVIFGVSSVGTLTPNGTARTITSDVTVMVVAGRPPSLGQTGGLRGPLLNLLVAGGSAISGTAPSAGATVAVLKRAGNMWRQVATATAATTAGADGRYPFTLTPPATLVSGETYSARSQDSGGSTWSPLAFPVAVQ